MKIRIECQDKYVHVFDYSSGLSITVDREPTIIRKRGPNLLDVSITNRCNRGCEFCYRASNHNGADMPFEDYKFVLDQALACGVQQIAIGGGEPTLHPYFCEILKMTHDYGIVPNFSTNGDQITDRIIDYSQKYCGSVAISIYDNLERYIEKINRLTDNGVRVNLHFILRADKLDYYTLLLRNPPKILNRINSIIFLNYKPLNYYDNICLNKASENSLTDFFKSIEEFDSCSVGFDTCSVSFIVRYLHIDPSVFDFCESGRTSAFIDESLNVSPCSFYSQRIDNLKKSNLFDIWNNSNSFVNHRKMLNVHQCKYGFSRICSGGCPLFNINKCSSCKR